MALKNPKTGGTSLRLKLEDYVLVDNDGIVYEIVGKNFSGPVTLRSLLDNHTVYRKREDLTFYWLQKGDEFRYSVRSALFKIERLEYRLNPVGNEKLVAITTNSTKSIEEARSIKLIENNFINFQE